MKEGWENCANNFDHISSDTGIMPLTNKQKMARKRERIKANDELIEMHRKKDKLRKRLQQSKDKKSMSSKDWTEYRAKENERIRRYRRKSVLDGSKDMVEATTSV